MLNSANQSKHSDITEYCGQAWLNVSFSMFTPAIFGSIFCRWLSKTTKRSPCMPDVLLALSQRTDGDYSVLKILIMGRREWKLPWDVRSLAWQIRRRRRLARLGNEWSACQSRDGNRTMQLDVAARSALVMRRRREFLHRDNTATRNRIVTSCMTQMYDTISRFQWRTQDFILGV